jgi:hypothetical protein
MSLEPISGRVDADIESRLEEFGDDRDLDDSTALRRCLDEGLRQYGYTGGGAGTGYAQTVLTELAKALLWIGAAMFIATVLTPLYWAFPASAFWLLAALCLLVVQTDIGVSEWTGGGA